jgi:hypothetical protein
MPIPAGFKSFTASRIQNASGGPLAVGTLGVVPTDENDCPISAIAGGVGGAITFNEDQTPVAGGTIGNSFVVADTEAAEPKIYYRIVIRCPDGTPIFILKGVRTIDASFDLGSYNPLTGHSGGAISLPDLIFAAPDSTLWRLARDSGALTAKPYSGSLFAQTLYLNDTVFSGNVYQLTIGDGGEIDWALVSGVTGLDSVTFTDDNPSFPGTFTLTLVSGGETWT